MGRPAAHRSPIPDPRLIPDVPQSVRRQGLVDHRGRPALAISNTTPAEAAAEDLLFIRRALDASGIPFFLIRKRSNRPTLAIDSKRRAQVVIALASAADGQPFYVRLWDGERFRRTQRLMNESLHPEVSAHAIRVFRRRVEPGSGLHYGASTAVEIQFWDVLAEQMHVPAPNVLTRPCVATDTVVVATVERYGETWQTIDGMFTPEPTEISLPIDLVFSWVGASSDEWEMRRALRMRSHVVATDDRSPARFRQIDELKFALRSVHMYAPWVRRIFIATDSPHPDWLAEHPRVSVVRSGEFFKDGGASPTYNSHAVESRLHHIPGLAEHFVYSNDDMFFGRAVKPAMFFASGQVSKFIESSVRIGVGGPDPSLSGFENAARNNRRLLLDRFGVIITRHLAHAPVPLRRSVLYEMEQEFVAEFEATAANPFRGQSDISVTNSFYHYYALLTGRAVVQECAKVAYVDTTRHSDLDALGRLLKKRENHFFCLNDGGREEVDAEVRRQRVTDFLERYFPIPAPWEIA